MSPRLIPDPVEHTPVLRNGVVALGHFRLHSYRAFNRIDHRRKLKQHAVARGLDDPAAMLCHQCVGDSPVFAESAGGADFVEAHEPRKASHVSGYNSC
jgi:hypothetical protein